MFSFKSKLVDPLSKYTPVGVNFCQGKCDRKVIVTSTGPVITCDGCNRIVIDNRK